MNDIIALLTSHNYLALALFAIVYARKLFSADSKFPITVSPQALPVITGFLAMGYGEVTDLLAHKALLASSLDALAIGGSVGVADALLTAIFSSGNAPKWAKALVFIFDDLTGQTPPAPPAPPSPTPASKS
jgi:hypothetical protein